MIILSKPSKTARVLASEMGIKLIYRPIRTQDTILRWGSVLELPRGSHVINKRSAILTTSNKYSFLSLMKNNGLPTPEITDDPPCVGRPYHHQQGRGFFMCRSREDVEWARRRGAQYFTKFFDKTHEYRVHIGFGKTILMSEKTGNGRDVCWNTKNGFTFRHMGRSEWQDDDFLVEMVRSSKKAIQLAGLDFGAVDIMADNDRFVLLEINSAPSLSPLAIKKYIQCFKANVI